MDEEYRSLVQQRLRGGLMSLIAVVWLSMSRVYAAKAATALDEQLSSVLTYTAALIGSFAAWAYVSGYHLLLRGLDMRLAANGHLNPAKSRWLIPTLRLAILNPTFFFGLVAAFIGEFIFPRFGLRDALLPTIGLAWGFIAFSFGIFQFYRYQRANEKDA